jgi:hypothetical protein
VKSRLVTSTVWRTTDDATFYSEGEAVAHQKEVDTRADVDAIVDLFHYPNMTRSDLVDHIMEHLKDLCAAGRRKS